jgi:hypothetical protein
VFDNDVAVDPAAVVMHGLGSANVGSRDECCERGPLLRVVPLTRNAADDGFITISPSCYLLECASKCRKEVLEPPQG